MDINKIQTDLIVKGYTNFNIINYSKELYHYLLPLRCNKYTDLKQFMTSVRVDGNPKESSNDIDNIHLDEEYDTFEIAKAKRIETIGSIADKKLIQAWHYGLAGKVLASKSLNIDNLNDMLFKMVKECFNLDESIELISVVNNVTFYDTECMITNHKDGNDEERVCSLLIYLNQDYDINDGGCLVLENETIIPPIFGNVALISLDTKFNVQHQVTRVVDGMGRYALCFFIKKRND
jgi:hypothetical protein